MKKHLIILLLILPLYMVAQDKPKEEKKIVKLYGFFKGDMVYATNGVYSWGNVTNCSNLGAPQIVSDTENPALGFTAQHTRFGIKVSQGGDIKVGGKLELDFYGGGFDANIKPRIRQAYASVAKGGFEARFGQQWDIFSPNNASTNNTNGNMWYAGNRGFRRGQIQLIYKYKINDDLVPMLQVSVGEATKEGSGLGADNMAVSPMIQARLSAKIKEKFVIGASYVMANYNTDPLNDSTLVTFSTSGICVDWSLPLHKYFALKGEFNTGTNLNNANLFNIAGNHGWGVDSTISGDDKTIHLDKESMGMWLNVTSKIHDHFHVVIGYGMDINNTDDLGVGSVEGNTVIYGDLVFPIKNGFSVALEVQNITTTIGELNDNGVDVDFNDKSVLVINLSGKIVF